MNLTNQHWNTMYSTMEYLCPNRELDPRRAPKDSANANTLTKRIFDGRINRIFGGRNLFIAS